ncbi:ABC transporter ATP-binding protein [Erysipelothrix sp. HDW6A]|uniref:ABC transporter ATP-binding protein n=1 Tax=Erysipelothrix sp. HDW6A TaxID=2714928 RepID=UPI001407F882|nr:ABC transporter ATP-binding protein [Erysipelothrix sp. HDW6A]QIK58035.1 ABC transporter ATP-binding protein [Erysipelothrix sp. HDW6A]
MEKKKRSVIENIRYYFSQIREDNPKIYVYSGIHILATIVVVSITSIIPTLLIGILTKSPENVGSLSPVFLLFVVLGVLTYTQLHTGIVKDIQSIMVRILSFGRKVYVKFLTMDYETLEEDDVQKQYRRATENGLSNNSAGTESMFKHVETILINVGIILIFGIFLTTFNPIAFLLILAVGILNSYLLTFTRKYREKTRPEWTKIETQRYQLKRDALKSENGKDARIYNVKEIYNKKVDDLTEKRMMYERKEANITLITSIIGTSVTLIRDVFIYTVLVKSVLDGSMSIVEFTLFFNIMGMFNQWITAIVDSIHQVGLASQDIDDVRNFLEVEDTTDGIDVPKADSYTLEFDEVSYRYPGLAEDTLKNLSFSLSVSHSIALVGINGAGKSTIVKLMLGLIRPSTGVIRLNGIDITEFNRRSYFEMFAPAFQENEVWALTLAQNIAMSSDELDEAKIEELLGELGLNDVVDDLPKGIQTNMTTNIHLDGTNLSGGQSQRLMLARALFKDAPFLVLDEPTAALDAIAEQAMYEKYHEYSSNKASLFISHRLSSTRFCDEVLFLENGEIIERGTHASLLKNDGPYANMFKVQSQYYQKGETNEETNSSVAACPIN